MKSRNMVAVLAAVCVLIGAMAPAQSKPASVLDQLKPRVGQWEGTTVSGKSIRISYEIASGGTALLERLQPADEPEMITVYTADGDRVAVTHFCSANNQPQMRTAPISGSAKRFAFSLVRVTNLASPDAGHMRQLVVTLQDKDHFTQEWTWKEKGKTKIEVLRFTRNS